MQQKYEKKLTMESKDDHLNYKIKEILFIYLWNGLSLNLFICNLKSYKEIIYNLHYY